MTQPDLKLTEHIKSLAISLGADLVGIADASAFAKAPAGLRACDFLPSATSVVVMARKMPMTVILRGDKKRQTHLAAATYITLNNMITELTRYLEDEGYEALPVYHVYFVTGAAQPGDRIEDRFDLSYKHSAIKAGLGQLGLHNLLITQKYGPAVRLTTLLTNAPLKANQSFQDKICRQDKGCQACAEACPVGAITKEGFDKRKCWIHLQQDYARYHYGSCVQCMAACCQALAKD